MSTIRTSTVVWVTDSPKQPINKSNRIRLITDLITDHQRFVDVISIFVTCIGFQSKLKQRGVWLRFPQILSLFIPIPGLECNVTRFSEYTLFRIFY